MERKQYTVSIPEPPVVSHLTVRTPRYGALVFSTGGKAIDLPTKKADRLPAILEADPTLRSWLAQRMRAAGLDGDPTAAVVNDMADELERRMPTASKKLELSAQEALSLVQSGLDVKPDPRKALREERAQAREERAKAREERPADEGPEVETPATDETAATGGEVT